MDYAITFEQAQHPHRTSCMPLYRILVDGKDTGCFTGDPEGLLAGTKPEGVQYPVPHK